MALYVADSPGNTEPAPEPNVELAKVGPTIDNELLLLSVRVSVRLTAVKGTFPVFVTVIVEDYSIVEI